MKITTTDTLIFFAWIAVDWTIIVAAILAAIRWDHLVGCWLATLVVGTRQHAISILGHEAGHRIVSRNRFVNDWLAPFFTFWPLGASLPAYREFHLLHHKYVGTDLDPELPHKRALQSEWVVPNSRWFLAYLTITDLLGCGFFNVFWIFRLAGPKTIKDALPGALFVTAALAALFLTGNWRVVAIWYFSLLTSFWAVFRWRIWFEHQEENAITSRVAVPRWLAWIIAPHNTLLHWEHHLDSKVPQHRLREVRAANLLPPIVPAGELLRSMMTHR